MSQTLSIANIVMKKSVASYVRMRMRSRFELQNSMKIMKAPVACLLMLLLHLAKCDVTEDEESRGSDITVKASVYKSPSRIHHRK